MLLRLKPVVVLALALWLLSCQSLPGPTSAPLLKEPTRDLHAEYRALAAQGGVVYALDPAASDVRIYVFRGGTAARLGHNHILSVPQFEGYIFLPSQDDPTQSRFDLQVPLASLVVDDPRLRAETGGAFSGERSESDIEGTRRNMLGARGLDATQFPIMSFQSVSVSGDWPVLVVEMDIRLHGVTRRQSVPLQVMHGRRGVIVKGGLILRQSDFGISPYALFGGLMAIQDEVVIMFELGGNLE